MKLRKINLTKSGYAITCTTGSGDTYTVNVPADSGTEEVLISVLHPLAIQALESQDFELIPDRIGVKSIAFKEQKEAADSIQIDLLYANATGSAKAADTVLKMPKEVEQQAQKYAQNKFWALNSQTSIFAGSGQADTEVEIEFNPATNEN